MYWVTLNGQQVPVLARYREWARKLDRDGDFHLTLEELQPGEIPRLRADRQDLAVETLHQLTGTPSQYRDSYPDLEELQRRLQDLCARSSGRLRLTSLGESTEGRPIWAVRVSSPGSRPTRGRAVIVAQQHAREWATQLVCLRSLERLAAEPDLAGLYQDRELWFVPLANPDGYLYSRDVDVEWRKNRRPVPGGQIGVDLNRNYPAPFRPDGDTEASTKDDVGASDNPASLAYRGPAPFSEPETQALRPLLEQPELAGVLDLHSFGCRVVLPNEDSRVSQEEYRRLGDAMLQALGPDYEAIPFRRLYPISGYLAGFADRRGIPGVTLEMGEAFQPRPARLASLVETGAGGVIAFLRALFA